MHRIKLYKIIQLDYISRVIFTMSIIFIIFGLVIGFTDFVLTTVLAFTSIAIVLAITAYFRMRYVKLNIEQHIHHQTTAKILKITKSRKLYYVHLAYTNHNQEYTRYVIVPKSQKAKTTINQEYLTIVYDPNQPKKVYILDLLY